MQHDVKDTIDDLWDVIAEIIINTKEAARSCKKASNEYQSPKEPGMQRHAS